MNFGKHKRMLIWDLKELDGFSHQTLTVEPFNMWPSGNCGHVYSSAHSQARRHISGWAMRNTNNHNINILKKSCLGVLVCNLRCKKSDGHVVAVRPAICDKARRKQIGRRCPNSCGGVLTMQQCKGHNGYPVTHFWRHHEDKVFFLGKGYHDHPKPELKLGAEKRKTYVRVSNKKPISGVSSHIKTRLATAASQRRQTHGQNQCNYPGPILQQPSHSFTQPYQQPISNPYEEQQSPPSYPYPIQPAQLETAPRLVVPDCDIYIPPISQDILSASMMSPYYNTQSDLSYKPACEQPNVYLLPMSSTTFPVDYSLSPGTFPAGFGRQIDAYGRNPYSDAATTSILDLSSATNTQLDSSWHSDPSDQRLLANNRYYTKNVAHFQTSTLTMSSQVFEREQPEAPKPPTSLRYYNKRRDDVPQRLRALWDSIYPTDEPYGSSLAQALDENPSSSGPTEPVKIDPITLNTELENANTSGDVSLKEMMDIDNLDMGDISNILNIPAGSAKLKSSLNEEKRSSQTGPLPNLSSFLKGLDYL